MRSVSIVEPEHAQTMRKSILLFFITASSFNALATDRVVSADGLYPTIGEALLASSDGDRILVQPGIYPEDVFISKTISILPNQEGTRPRITGNVTLADADGKHVLLSGLRMENLIRTGTFTQRTEVDVVDCRVGFVTLKDPYLYVRLLRDTVNYQASLSSGAVVGSDFLGGGAGAVAFVSFEPPVALPDEIVVIGNTFGTLVTGSGVLIFTNARFHIQNNYMRCFTNEAIRVHRPSAYSGAICTILNNTFTRSETSSTTVTAITNFPVSPLTMNVRNNAIIGYTSGMGIGTPHVSNVITGEVSIDIATGAPSIASPLINAGDPDPRYLDLDLTTNDVGCYGGSNSRANFTTGMGSAVVGFMQAPRVVAQGDAVNINAIGFDR